MISHRFIHDTLALSTPFLLTAAASAIGSTAIGLLLSRRRRLSAASRHLLLSIALIAPPLAALAISLGANDVLRLRPAAATGVVTTSIGNVAAVRRAPPPSSELPCLAFVLWATGAALFATSSFRQWMEWSRAVRYATPKTNDALNVARLAESHMASEPMVVGILRPVILLPRNYPLDGEELKAVFAHETEHIRRRDNLSAAVHEAVCAVFWFDPLHRIARRRLLELRERACDERVLQLGCGVEPYIAALAKSCHAAIESAAVACMSGFHVQERIESIMSYQSDRTHFLSEKAVRFAAWTGAAVLVAIAALVTPQPSLASPAEGTYALEVQLRPGPNGRVLVNVNVTAPDGDRVLDSKATTMAGQPVRLSATRGERTYQVDVAPDASGGGTATLDVIDGNNTLYHSTRTVAAIAPRRNAEPIALNLKDADIRDVLKSFAAVTGLKFVIDPSVTGKVSINVQDTPWDEALTQVLAQLGLAAEVKGDHVDIVRASEATTYRRVEGGVRAPEVLTRVQPVYTAEAKKERIAGIAIIEVSVDDTGAVRDTKILKNLPFGLGESAADAVRQWIFAPAMLDGKPVPVKFNVTVNFRPDEGEEKH